MPLSDRFKDVVDGLFGADAQPQPEQTPAPHRFRQKVHKVDSWEADFITMTLSLERSDGPILSIEPTLFDLCDEHGELYMRFESDGRAVAIANIESRLASDDRDRYNDERDRYELARLKADKPMRVPAAISDELQAAYKRFLAGRAK